jgi:Flp pilus assembly pilin Flp
MINVIQRFFHDESIQNPAGFVSGFRRLAVATRGLIVEDAGQDLIEYALLSAFIGVAGAAAWNAIGSTIFDAYGTWNTGANCQWESPAPGAASTCP